MNKYQGLKISDNILMMILNSVASVVKPLDMPYQSFQMTAVEGVTESFSIQPADFCEMENGQEIYKIWKELTETAENQKKYCLKIYNDSGDKIISLENRINACYKDGDALTGEYDGFMAKKQAYDKKITLVQKSIDEMNHNIVSLTDKISGLEKDKEIYDALRFIPFVNLFSEIVVAVKGTRDELEAKKRELDHQKSDLHNIYVERNHIVSEITEIERKISRNAEEKERLQQEREACQKRRDTASKEMIDWKDREKYYQEIEEKMKHLIAMEADVDEFRKLLAENPPKFQMVM